MATINQSYTPFVIRRWSFDLRMSANRISKAKIANHFYNVHYAIGPTDMADCLSLDEHHLRLLAEEEGKSPEKVMRELIESIKVVLREGDKLGPEIINKKQWDSGLRNYLCDLKKHLEGNLAQNSVKRSKVIRELCHIAACILFFLTGSLAFGKYEPRILFTLGCLLPAILLAFFSMRNGKK
jgi:hypothetical protein